jgi:colanic acid biosynthesis glycosyl transferase WcaI
VDRSDVVIVGLNYAPEQTGIAPYTTGLARSMAAAGLRVTCITGKPHYPEWRVRPGYEGPLRPTFLDGVKVVRVRHSVPRHPTGISRVLMEATFALNAGLALLRNQAPVIICVSPALLSIAPALLVRCIRRRTRVGIVVQDLYGAALQETSITRPMVARASGRLERFLLARSDGVAAIHDVFRTKLLRDGLRASSVKVIPNWSHVEGASIDRDLVRHTLGWRSDEVIALHAGNMGVKQHLETLVDAARVAKSQGSRVRIVLAGDGSRRASLEDYARNASRVGFIDSLPPGGFEEALAAADILLLNEKEGVLEMSVPSKLTTYFAAGRPVVAATDSRSAAAQLIAKSGAGIVTPPGDASALHAAIIRIAESPAFASALSQNGRRFADEHLKAAVSLTAYLDWIKELSLSATDRLHRG